MRYDINVREYKTNMQIYLYAESRIAFPFWVEAFFDRKACLAVGAGHEKLPNLWWRTTTWIKMLSYPAAVRRETHNAQKRNGTTLSEHAHTRPKKSVHF